MPKGPRELRLLPRSAVLKTGGVDHADWNYRPILGSISRIRFKLVVSLLEERPARRLLEIGYGSGVFMPALATLCDELYGIDVHRMTAPVGASLARCNLQPRLFCASAAAMPFVSQTFNAVVAVSALEFVIDLEAACREIQRVLTPGGALVVVLPGHSALVDMGLRLLTGKSATDDFEDRREKIIPTLLRHFRVERQLVRPAVGNAMFRLYTGLRLRSGAR